MREADPVSGVPNPGRDADNFSRGGAGTYNYRPVTLEEETANGGWLPGARPTGDNNLNDLYTIGMRGEPRWDDDPQFNNGSATVTHASTGGGDDGSD